MYMLRPNTEGTWLQRHSLSIMVALVLLVQAVVAYLAAYPAWVIDHAGSGRLSIEYWHYYFGEINLSLMAEPWGFLVGVLLTKWFYERDSAESD